MRLQASLDFGEGRDPVPVGKIAWSSEERRAFVEWAPGFHDRGLPISPFLVRDWTILHGPEDPVAFDGLPAVFGDSVPDGWGRLLMDQDLARRGVEVPRPMAHLALVGRSGMGALCFEPADAEADRLIDLSPDTFAHAADDIEELDDSVLAGLRSVAGGSQGARPKFVALYDPGSKGFRDHREGWANDLRHVLVKRAAREDLPSAVPIEAGYAQAARAAGIDMTGTEAIRATSGERFFMTDRFDRDGHGRLHVQTAAALLEADHRRGQMSYENIFEIARRLHGDDRASEQLYRRMIFNVATVNCDDHAKNHAFLMDPQGVWRLAPAYDLTFSEGRNGYHAMTLSKASSGMKPEAILDLAVRYGIEEPRARDLTREVVDIARELPTILRREGVPQRSAQAIGRASAMALGCLPMDKPKREAPR